MNMNLQHLLNQLTGSGGTASGSGNSAPGISDTLSRLGGQLPGGLAGGAAAGGLMALLMGNRSARKFVGKAATFGGAALLGGMAYKAYSNWQHNKGRTTAWSGTANGAPAPGDVSIPVDTEAPDFQLQLIKAMIAAAQADGHIDAVERQHIFKAVAEMDLPAEVKGIIFDLLQQPIAVEELAAGAATIEQRSEIYLASCLVIKPDQPSEQAYLGQLEAALELPEGLAEQLEWQAQRVMAQAA